MALLRAWIDQRDAERAPAAHGRRGDPPLSGGVVGGAQPVLERVEPVRAHAGGCVAEAEDVAFRAVQRLEVGRRIEPLVQCAGQGYRVVEELADRVGAVVLQRDAQPSASARREHCSVQAPVSGGASSQSGAWKR